MPRITKAYIAAKVAQCPHRLYCDPHRGWIAQAQGETVRGEPRWFYVICEQPPKYEGGTRDGNSCKCAGDDSHSEATIIRRAEYVIDARMHEREKAGLDA